MLCEITESVNDPSKQGKSLSIHLGLLGLGLGPPQKLSREARQRQVRTGDEKEKKKQNRTRFTGCLFFRSVRPAFARLSLALSWSNSASTAAAAAALRLVLVLGLASSVLRQVFVGSFAGDETPLLFTSCCAKPSTQTLNRFRNYWVFLSFPLSITTRSAPGPLQSDGSTCSATQIQPSTCQEVDDSDCAEISAAQVQLPEDILHRIHTLMEMQDAAQAACVCRSFLRSWRCYPNLDLPIYSLGIKQDAAAAAATTTT